MVKLTRSSGKIKINISGTIRSLHISTYAPIKGPLTIDFTGYTGKNMPKLSVYDIDTLVVNGNIQNISRSALCGAYNIKNLILSPMVQSVEDKALAKCGVVYVYKESGLKSEIESSGTVEVVEYTDINDIKLGISSRENAKISMIQETIAPEWEWIAYPQHRQHFRPLYSLYMDHKKPDPVIEIQHDRKARGELVSYSGLINEFKKYQTVTREPKMNEIWEMALRCKINYLFKNAYNEYYDVFNGRKETRDVFMHLFRVMISANLKSYEFEDFNVLIGELAGLNIYIVSERDEVTGVFLLFNDSGLPNLFTGIGLKFNNFGVKFTSYNPLAVLKRIKRGDFYGPFNRRFCGLGIGSNNAFFIDRIEDTPNMIPCGYMVPKYDEPCLIDDIPKVCYGADLRYYAIERRDTSYKLFTGVSTVRNNVKLGYEYVSSDGSDKFSISSNALLKNLCCEFRESGKFIYEFQDLTAHGKFLIELGEWDRCPTSKTVTLKILDKLVEFGYLVNLTGLYESKRSKKWTINDNGFKIGKQVDNSADVEISIWGLQFTAKPITISFPDGKKLTYASLCGAFELDTLLARLAGAGRRIIKTRQGLGAGDEVTEVEKVYTGSDLDKKMGCIVKMPQNLSEDEKNIILKRRDDLYVYIADDLYVNTYNGELIFNLSSRCGATARLKDVRVYPIAVLLQNCISDYREPWNFIYNFNDRRASRFELGLILQRSHLGYITKSESPIGKLVNSSMFKQLRAK